MVLFDRAQIGEPPVGWSRQNFPRAPFFQVIDEVSPRVLLATLFYDREESLLRHSATFHLKFSRASRLQDVVLFFR